MPRHVWMGINLSKASSGDDEMFSQSTGPDAERYKYSQNSLFETPRDTPACLAVFLAKNVRVIII